MINIATIQTSYPKELDQFINEFYSKYDDVEVIAYKTNHDGTGKHGKIYITVTLKGEISEWGELKCTEKF